MFKQLLPIIALIALILPPPAPTVAQAQPQTWVCEAEAPHAVYLPFIAGGVPVPKGDLLRKIDESSYGANLTDADIFDPSETSAPNVPSGITVTAVQDGILVNVDFNVDTAHLHPRFQSFIVYGKPVNTEIDDGTGHELGRFSDNDWVWQVGTGGYTAWHIALSAISNTGVESSKSSWYRCIISTHYDDFSDFGGDEVSSVESLFWLKIANCDSGENWVTEYWNTVTDDTTYYKEGNGGKRATVGAADTIHTQSAYTFPSAIDLTAEGRFESGDYVTLALYSSAALDTIYISFISGGSAYDGEISTGLSAGWNYLKVQQGDFVENGTPDWSNITGVRVASTFTGATPGGYISWDDFRIVKASSNDPSGFSDTGDVWLTNAGTWHVVPGNRPGEPSYGYSLAQVESPADDDYFAVPPTVAMPANKVSVGVYLKDGEGRAGLLFRVGDDTLGSEDALAAEIDTSDDTLYLVRYEDGSKSTLASVDVSATPLGLSPAPNRVVWLGVDFRDPGNEGRVKVYVAASESYLFRAPALQISHATTAPWPDGRGVGLVAHACNARFVEYRAGSTQTSDYAHKAGHALTAGCSVEDYGAAVARRVALPATVGVWSMASVQRSTGNVYDSSGQGRTLTYNGDPAFDWLDNGTPYIVLDGDGDYLSRTDETDLSVTGAETVVATARRGLALITWCWFDGTGSIEYFVSKNGGSGQYSYWLHKLATEAIQFQVSSDGTGLTSIASGDTFAAAAWHFVAGVLHPSDDLRLMVDGNWYSNTTFVPASVFNSNADFVIGGISGGTGLLTGRESLSSLHFCALDDEIVERIYQGEKALFGI